jgi:nucleoid-associated protein YgaU
MKQPKKVEDLAASLLAASAAPLVSPAAPAPASEPAAAEPPAAQERTAAPAKAAEKGKGKKEPADTMQLTLRPTRTLYGRYVAAAADRSRQAGRMVTPQEVMLEILEKGEV